MKRYVTDTQCQLWYISDDRRLPKAINRVYNLMEDSQAQILVPSVVIVEAIFLMQRQRIPKASVEFLLNLTEEPDATLYVTPLTMQVVAALSDFGPAAIPEMGDRIIAATARAFSLPLLTTDHIIIDSKLVKVIE